MRKIAISEKDRIATTAIPQKFADFYQPGDPAIPAALGADALPFPCPEVSAFCMTEDGAVWLSDGKSVTRVCGSEKYFRDRVQYFRGNRWLPDGKITALLADGDGIWAASENGVSHIYFKNMTMDEKAELYDSRILTRQTRHGFVADTVLNAPRDFSEGHHGSQDNDGLWTAMYAAGACFEYAVTGSESAHERARVTTEAVLSLVDVTGIKGYFARSYIKEGEQLPSDDFWIKKPDADITWKSDTSSDEAVGHFMLYLLAHELLPDEDIKRRTEKAAEEICDFIIANDYYLVDVTGRPTTWGRWNTEYFNGRGYSDTSLNAAEILSFLKVASYITGMERFEKAYRHLAFDLGYLDLVNTYLERKEEINYSDEELCYLSYLPLILLEDDEKILARYRSGMAQWWINISRELNPLWTYIYKLADPSAECDMEGALWTLRRMPSDMCYYNIKNSDRADMVPDGGLDRFNHPQTLTIYPPDERQTQKWNGNPFVPDGSGDGRREEPGTVYTLPYWLGRYFGFLK